MKIEAWYRAVKSAEQKEDGVIESDLGKHKKEEFSGMFEMSTGFFFWGGFVSKVGIDRFNWLARREGDMHPCSLEETEFSINWVVGISQLHSACWFSLSAHLVQN